MTVKSAPIDDFNLHAANMRRPGVAAPFCPPTADEMLLNDNVRGCIDTIRFNCRRAHLDDFSKACLRALDFTFKGPEPISLKNGGKYTRSIWVRNDGLVVIDSSLYGLSIQFSPPRIAFGRNDRQADVDHAGIASFVRFFVTKVLGVITDAAMQRLADEERRRDERRVHDICWAHVWRPTRLDVVVHCWLSDDEIKANPQCASNIIESVRYARQGMARLPPFAYSAAADKVTEADLAEDKDFEYATRRLKFAAGGHKLAIGVATKKTGSSRRVSLYLKRHEQMCKGMTAERLVKGQVVRCELTLLSQDLIQHAQLLNPYIYGMDSAFYMWPKGKAPVAIGLPTGGLLRLLYDELALISTRVAMGTCTRLSGDDLKARKAAISRCVNTLRGNPGPTPMTVWRDRPDLAADAMREHLCRVRVPRRSMVDPLDGEDMRSHRRDSKEGQCTPLTRLFFPDGPAVHGIRTKHESTAFKELKRNRKHSITAAKSIARKLATKRKKRASA